MRSLDLKPTEAQWLEGADVSEVQRALGFRGRDGLGARFFVTSSVSTSRWGTSRHERDARHAGTS